jgi:hypothetical protein
MDAADTGDGSWLTYGQLAEARQISRRAAVRLAQRHHLRRQPGNDGSVRVWVPADMAASSPFRPFPPASPEADADDTSAADATPLHAQALAALEDALRAADARADAALALADKLAAELADAGDRSDRLERDLAAARTAVDHALALVTDAQAERDRERSRADALQHELRQAQEAAELRVDDTALGEAQERAQQAESRGDAARAQAEELRVDLDELRAQLAELREDDAARRAMGLLARLLAALRWR